MKSFLAIVRQTMRSAIRAKVFHVLGVLILLSVFLLPATVSGDGTAKGLVQISLTYSLGIVVALILWLALLNRETLLGTQAAYQPLRVFRTAWKNIQKYGITGNFLGNIIAFMPFGFLLPAVTGKEKWYLTIPAGLGFSCMIELIQLATSLGYFDPDDIILNTLGTAIGYGAYLLTKGFWKNERASGT